VKIRPLLLACTAAAAACGFEAAPRAESVETGTGLQPTAPIEEVMRYMIDPSADSIWEAVVVDVTANGTTSRAPVSDEDWLALRRHAVIIAEATNLLLMEGRPVAAPGSRSEWPGVDLEPEQIEALLAADRGAWSAFVSGLRESARVVLDAVDRKDVDALLGAGDGLDLACENCHVVYWYPSLADSGAAGAAERADSAR
jgi:hypothetical protein